MLCQEENQRHPSYKNSDNSSFECISLKGVEECHSTVADSLLKTKLSKISKAVVYKFYGDAKKYEAGVDLMLNDDENCSNFNIKHTETLPMSKYGKK